jgi:hypothetical protein
MSFRTKAANQKSIRDRYIAMNPLQREQYEADCLAYARTWAERRRMKIYIKMMRSAAHWAAKKDQAARELSR